MSDNDLRVMAKTMKEESFSANAIIFNENTHGERLYLILDGRVRISKITKYGAETPLAVLGKGDFFATAVYGTPECFAQAPPSSRPSH